MQLELVWTKSLLTGLKGEKVLCIVQLCLTMQDLAPFTVHSFSGSLVISFISLLATILVYADIQLVILKH